MDKIEFIDSQGLPRAIKKSAVNQVAILKYLNDEDCWLEVTGLGFIQTVAEADSVEEMMPIYREWVEKVWGEE